MCFRYLCFSIPECCAVVALVAIPFLQFFRKYLPFRIFYYENIKAQVIGIIVRFKLGCVAYQDTAAGQGMKSSFYK